MPALRKQPLSHPASDNTQVARTPSLEIKPRRRNVPGPRALIGGLLIATAFVGTYAAAAGAIGNDSRSVVVATHDIPAGTRITAADLRMVEATLPDVLTVAVAGSIEQVEGATLVGPLAEGELLQAGNVIRTANGLQRPEISFAIESSRAVGGRLRSGETVDVIATDKNTGGSLTAVAGATVVRIEGVEETGLGAGELLITLAVADRAEAAAVARAVDAGAFTLVRTTGLAPASTPAPAIPPPVQPAPIPSTNPAAP